MAYEAQSTIGWEHLLKGKIPERMGGLQDWWERRGKGEHEKERDARNVVVSCMGYTLMTVYEIWKMRCKEAAKVELPTRLRCKLSEVSEMADDINLVEARDRFLFDEKSIPNEKYDLQRIEDWLISVRRSKERAGPKIKTRRPTRAG